MGRLTANTTGGGDQYDSPRARDDKGGRGASTKTSTRPTAAARPVASRQWHDRLNRQQAAAMQKTAVHQVFDNKFFDIITTNSLKYFMIVMLSGTFTHELSPASSEPASTENLRHPPPPASPRPPPRRTFPSVALPFWSLLYAVLPLPSVLFLCRLPTLCLQRALSGAVLAGALARGEASPPSLP